MTLGSKNGSLKIHALINRNSLGFKDTVTSVNMFESKQEYWLFGLVLHSAYFNEEQQKKTLSTVKNHKIHPVAIDYSEPLLKKLIWNILFISSCISAGLQLCPWSV